jgi:membrane protein
MRQGPVQLARFLQKSSRGTLKHPWNAGLHTFSVFRYLVMRLYYGHFLLYCGSLAYSLIVAFIPLVASFSLFAGKVYELNRTKIHLILSKKEFNALILNSLPYSSRTIDDYILQLVRNATTIGWIGIAVLLVSAVGLYNTLEEIFNVTWNAGRGRPVHKNLGMILFITALFGITFTLYVKLGGLPLWRHYLGLYFLGKASAFMVLILAFTVLYKLIPQGYVSKRASLYGGVFAAALYELCRAGLHFYVTRILAYSKLWGSLSLIPVFILTVYALAVIIILGNDVTYIVQNRKRLREDLELREHFLRR